MIRKRFNWKARQVVNTVIDNSKIKDIKVEFEKGERKYDDTNLLVLPSQKRKTKVKNDKAKVTRILSKKHRKKLEKIVERKLKKENRSNLFESLKEVQIDNNELSQLTSIASIQTKGLKRHFLEQSNPAKLQNVIEDNSATKPRARLNTLRGARRVVAENPNLNKQKYKNDPNVVGLQSSESSDSDDSLDDDTNHNVEVVTQVDKTSVTEDLFKSNVLPKPDDVLPESAVIPETKDIIPNNISKKPAVFVPVYRTKEIQAARLKLPILGEEQQIMETINENSVILLAGETGSGKTTQVPQFLYEAGYASDKQIAVTEPRRVAAISMSQRVAEEMNLGTNVISYLIRFEGNATEDTKIKFMTDGVLLKELQSDHLLRKYSVVIIDEAHERSAHTDILISFLSRIVKVREKKSNPLKLIIMSATLSVDEFISNKRLFKDPPPVINVETRQYKITVHYNKRTEENYVKSAFKKAVKIHSQLPDGGILIFVTGQQEVNFLVNKLRKAFPLKRKSKVLETVTDEVKGNKKKRKQRGFNDDGDGEEDIEEGMKKALRQNKKIKIVPTINLEEFSLPGEAETTSDNDDNLSDLSDDDTSYYRPTPNADPLWTLPLYSLLPTSKQQRVFKPPPPGCRLCVISTNVAETSLTIPNIKYVIDTGKSKVKLYDKVTGVCNYVVSWISKASANQRAGRAGRVGEGHCYRLYSSAVFNDQFKEFSEPEIKQRPVDDIFLQLKLIGIPNVMNFPFPTSPDLLQMKTAEKRLDIIGAIKNGKITDMGKVISKFPVLPRYGKMLALSCQNGMRPYTVCLVAALSVQEVLLENPVTQISPEESKQLRLKWKATRRQWAGTGNSLLLGDNMVLLTAVGAAEYANSDGKLEKFCADNGLRIKAVSEIRKLRLQLTNEIKRQDPDIDLVVGPRMLPPTDVQAKWLRQILLSGLGDQVAKKIPLEEVADNTDKAKFKYAYRANDMEDPVFLHSSSVLRTQLPEFVVYQEIYEINGKMYMRGVTAIDPAWLPIYVPQLCNMSDPLTDPEPSYNPTKGRVYCHVNCTFGPQAWELPTTEIPLPDDLTGYKWFARFLLEGKVFPKLESHCKSLLSPPTLMIKSWAKLQPRTEGLLKALISRKCVTRDALEEVWAEDPNYLLEQYLKWLPQSGHGAIVTMWPPL